MWEVAASGARYNEFKVKMSSRNNVYLIYKNMPVVQKILNSPFLFVGFLVEVPVFPSARDTESYMSMVLKKGCIWGENQIK